MVTRTEEGATGVPETDSLDALVGEATMLDNTPDDGAQAVQQAAEQQAAAFVASAAAELCGALQMARGMLLPLLPDHKGQRLAVVWNDQVLQQSAQAGAAIMQMHGWTLGGVMGKYGPYVMLVAVLAGPVIETRKIMAAPDPKPVQQGGADGG